MPQPDVGRATDEAAPDDGGRRARYPAHYRWNFTVLSLDLAFYYLSTTLVSFSTILPAYLRHLSASNLVIGVLSALTTAGYSLPNLLFAPLTERVRRKKRLILFVTPGERLPYLALAACAAWLAVGNPPLALAITFAALLIFTCTGGALTPAWLDLIARAIPARRRGAFFGRSNALAGLMGIGGAVLAQHLLATQPYPRAYVELFLLAFVFVAISYAFFALNREQGPFMPGKRGSFWLWLRGLPAIVRGDANFAWYMLATLASSLAYSAAAFFTVVAINRLHVGDFEVGWYTAVLLAASTCFNLLWGWLADRRGHKVVLAAGLLGMLLAMPLSMVAPTPLAYALVFLLLGASVSAGQLSRLAIMLEFAPEATRPTYVGLASVAGAPLALLGPLVGGVVADRAGSPAAFAIFWLAGLVALWLLIRRVREPRGMAAAVTG
jgi:MFS family permease